MCLQAWGSNVIPLSTNVEALISRLGFWGLLYDLHKKDLPKIVQVIVKAPILLSQVWVPKPCTYKPPVNTFMKP